MRHHTFLRFGIVVLLQGLSMGLYAQRTYVQLDNDEILDSLGYAAYKVRIVKVLQTSVHPDYHIEREMFREVRRTQDSVVLRVQLQFDNSRPARDSLSPKPSRLQVGDTFPAMVVRDLSGQRFDLRDLAGKPALINFWFIACPPCLAEMPALGDIQRKLGDSIHFVAVTFEQPEAVRELLHRHPFPYRQVPVAQDLIDRVGIRSYPVNVFLDRDRVVQRIENGIPSEMHEGRMKTGTGEGFVQFLRGLFR